MQRTIIGSSVHSLWTHVTCSEKLEFAKYFPYIPSQQSDISGYLLGRKLNKPNSILLINLDLVHRDKTHAAPLVAKPGPKPQERVEDKHDM